MAAAAQTYDLEALGAYALRFVKPGFTVGLGTGRAASAFIRVLGDSGIKVRGVPTSRESEALAREVGIEVIGLDAAGRIDVTLDGADEVDPKLNLIKGWGGALVREKVVAMASRRRVILVGADKLVKRLGQRGRLPVEVVPFAAPYCIKQIGRLALKPEVRKNPNGGEFWSDNGNLILDCATRAIASPVRLERELRMVPGVVGTGLFVGIADAVVASLGDGQVRVLRRK